MNKKTMPSFFVQRLSPLLNSKLMFIVFAVFCIVSLACHSNAIDLNMSQPTSIADILVVQFNIYSYVFLCFAPLFIVVQNQFLRQNKFDEFVLIRYASRKEYFVELQIHAMIFTIFYRCVEVLITVSIYVTSCVIGGKFDKQWLTISPAIQKLMCINTTRNIAIILYTQVVLLLLYFMITQSMLIAYFKFGNGTIAISIPLCINFLLLLLIKVDFWLDNYPVLKNLLPHRNIFLNCIFSPIKNDFSFTTLAWTLLYWGILLIIAIHYSYKELQKKDFLYRLENAEQDDSH